MEWRMGDGSRANYVVGLKDHIYNNICLCKFEVGRGICQGDSLTPHGQAITGKASAIASLHLSITSQSYSFILSPPSFKILFSHPNSEREV